ncbi:MAG TPA: pantoate--beta-alanine ligase [Acidobacteriaceae bacterium]|nr:pantoate--beta-alanine ligase [Acidobacteriaceae bacterium]
MRIIHPIADARIASAELRMGVQRLGFVPTMGALHQGHISLVHAAKAACDRVAVSIFVNPTQFGPNEDYAKYPRTFDADCAALEREGVDLLFAPSAEEVYPAGASTFIDVGGVSDRLDGASRPGHFRGVATVVAKLFHIIGPDKAFFGQKDAAQVAILRKMMRDLNFPLELVICPIVREPDGLAMSSRNRYLSPAERKQALVLSHALHEVERLARSGATQANQLIATAQNVLASEPAIRVDYCKIVDPDTLEDLTDTRRGALIAIAAFVGATRLIDNALLPAAHSDLS